LHFHPPSTTATIPYSLLFPTSTSIIPSIIAPNTIIKTTIMTTIMIIIVPIAILVVIVIVIVIPIAITTAIIILQPFSIYLLFLSIIDLFI